MWSWGSIMFLLPLVSLCVGYMGDSVPGKNKKPIARQSEIKPKQARDYLPQETCFVCLYVPKRGTDFGKMPNKPKGV